jgi:hypothetical protein
MSEKVTPYRGDFLNEAQTEARLRFGKELSPAEVASEFARHDFDARIEHLKNLDNEDTSLREAAKRLPYTRALHDTHERLRKVGR